MVRIVKAAENRVTAVLRGIDRRRVTGFTQEKPYLLATYEPLVELRKDPIEIDGLGMAVYDVAKQLIAISPDIPDETAQVLDQTQGSGAAGRHRRRDGRSVAGGARLAAGRERRGGAAAPAAGPAPAQGRADQGQAEDRHAGARGVLEASARGGPPPEAQGNPGRAGRGGGCQRPRRLRREDQGGGDAGRRREDGAQAARSPASRWRSPRRSTPSSGPTSSGWSSCPGPSRPRTRSTSMRRARSSTPITTTCRR